MQRRTCPKDCSADRPAGFGHMRRPDFGELWLKESTASCSSTSVPTTHPKSEQALVCGHLHMQDMQGLKGFAHGVRHQNVGLMQDSTRLEALLTWMEEEPVQGSILFVVWFTLPLQRVLRLVHNLFVIVIRHPFHQGGNAATRVAIFAPSMYVGSACVLNLCIRNW